MKLSSIIALTFIVSILHGQISNDFWMDNDSFEVQLIYKFHCIDSIVPIEYFCLERINKEHDLYGDYSVYRSANKSCFVHAPGFYEVTGIIDNLEHNIIHVKSKSVIDTIHVYGIYLARSPGIPPWPYYSCYGSRCNGNVVEKWANGNIRISGQFKNGHIIKYDKFNKEGIIEKRIINRRIYELNEVYSNGNLYWRDWKFLLFSGVKIWDKNKGKYIR